MKKLFTIGLLCSLALSLNAQYMKLDASFYSQALDEIKKVDIYLPADYYENLDQKYAVIYYLHGATGNQNSGSTAASRYYALHSQNTTILSPPAIFVCPDGSCEPYAGSGYRNSVLYGNYDDYITKDLITFIQANFRAHPTSEFRFVTGESMGGYGSAWHATDKPELFRASFPFIGFIGDQPEVFLEVWKTHVYDENGSYHNISPNAGTYSMLFFTMAGINCPNMSLPPYYVEIPWDSTGALVDSVVAKWGNTASSKVNNIPENSKLAFFLGCGTEDEMGNYSGYLEFMDSLDKYNIPYDYNFFEGGHEDDFETWQKGFHWMDSIINYSFQTMGVEIFNKEESIINLYPNPTRQNLNISFYTSEPKTASLIIFNQTGQKLKTIELGNTTLGNNEIAIDISMLEDGIYFLQLQVDKSLITKKFVKR